MTIINDIRSLKHARECLLSELKNQREREKEQRRQIGGWDLTQPIEFLDEYIERLKRSPGLFDCPRCNGTGAYEASTTYGCVSRCRPCGGTGRVTQRDWNAWCDRLNSAPTLASQLGKRCPDCTCGATEQDWKERCHFHAIGLGLSLRAAEKKESNLE